MSPLRILPLVALVSACAHANTKRDHFAAAPHSCNVPATIIRYAIDPQFNQDEKAKILDAFIVWTTGTAGHVVFVEGSGLLILKTYDKPTVDHLVDTLPNKQPSSERLAGIWVPSGDHDEIHIITTVTDNLDFEAVVIHELGHELGLDHISGIKNTYLHPSVSDTPKHLLQYPVLPEADRNQFFHRRGCI